MSSISAINKQLKQLDSIISDSMNSISGELAGAYEKTCRSIESLCRAQKSLVETQIVIFVEATESDLDMPELPSFCEERKEDPEEESDL